MLKDTQKRKRIDKSLLWIGMLTYVLTIGLILWLLVCSAGCATGYATIIRSEYSEGKGKDIQEEYPRVYPACRIVVEREIPTWVYISGWKELEWYSPIMWPIGVIGTTSDMCISLVTDTLALPYDGYQTTKNPKGNTK